MNRDTQRILSQGQPPALPQSEVVRFPGEYVFITGTGTGVGKTVLAACLARYCAQSALPVKFLKPLCSGGRADVRALQRALDGRVSQREICYRSFPQSLTPMVAARRANSPVRIEGVLEWIQSVCAHTRRVVVEGAGGLLSPLGEGFAAPELIRALRARTVVVASNRLGMLNDVLLAERVLREEGVRCACVVSMQPARDTAVSRTNLEILRDRLPDVPLLEFPHLGRVKATWECLERCVKKSKKTLAEVLDCVSFKAPSTQTAETMAKKGLDSRAAAIKLRPT